VIVLQDVVVRYPGMARAALDGVNLRISAGETVALVGPSGSGKTTLLRTINALVAVTSGSVNVGDTAVQTLRGSALRRMRTRLAFIAQHHDLVDRLRVHQNVMAGALGRWSALHALRYLALPLAGELDEARTALERVGIPEKLRAKTSALSGGERQRVAIARALIQRPEAVLADEPVASLDAELATQIIELLTALARERGLALVCSLHQVQLAERHFDRIVRLERGRLLRAA
jgi:phosphonate transport system ATP-binding protein